jgi:hypothetical protein
MKVLTPAHHTICDAVVDDDASRCRSSSRLLRIAGIPSVSYASAEAFLEDPQRPLFDRLVLDIPLEESSGWEPKLQPLPVQGSCCEPSCSVGPQEVRPPCVLSKLRNRITEPLNPDQR